MMKKWVLGAVAEANQKRRQPSNINQIKERVEVSPIQITRTELKAHALLWKRGHPITFSSLEVDGQSLDPLPYPENKITRTKISIQVLQRRNREVKETLHLHFDNLRPEVMTILNHQSRLDAPDQKTDMAEYPNLTANETGTGPQPSLLVRRSHRARRTDPPTEGKSIVPYGIDLFTGAGKGVPLNSLPTVAQPIVTDLQPHRNVPALLIEGGENLTVRDSHLSGWNKTNNLFIIIC